MTRNTATCECECPEGKEKCKDVCYDKCSGAQTRNTETCACGCPEGEKDCGGWCCPSDNTCGNASTKQCCKDSLCCENGLKVLAAPVGTYDEGADMYDYNGWWCFDCDGHLGCGTAVAVDFGGFTQFCRLNQKVLNDSANPGLSQCCDPQYTYADNGNCCCSEACILDGILYDEQCNLLDAE